MSWLKGAGSELIGLFVDDGAFAASIVAWLIACGMVLPQLRLPPSVPPAMLFAGLVLILAISALRRAGEGP